MAWCIDHVLGRSQYGKVRSSERQKPQRRDYHRRRDDSVQHHQEHGQKPELRPAARVPRSGESRHLG